ncbi:response regulator [Oryzibacter oryziterrae]|uniref:response regulator n=1 Tax=Oryzibacter oryziterrae TaxID=2766474 RepID=UPI001F355C54|nr:response regulator [Oryzibacter oryziterrae]
MTEAAVNILIADDSQFICTFIGRALARLGRKLDIALAKDGHEAVQMLNTRKFDVAFVDINMPQFSGVGVMAAVQMLNQRTLCISMSDRLDEETEKKLKSFGAYDFMPKPFTEAQVQRAVELHDLINTTFEVLVVDDSATVRRIVTKVLTRSIFSLNLTEAGSGNEAIAHVKTKSFRLIFSDFNMPGMTGIEMAQEISRLSRAADIVLMSTEFSAVLDDAARNVGARAFLRKPFFPEDVDSILHHVFGLPCPRFSKQVRLFATT